MDKQLEYIKQKLGNNNFEVFIAADEHEARHLFLDRLLPALAPKTVSYADSKTMHASRVLDDLRKNSGIRFIDTFQKETAWREQIYRRKEALTVDLFLTGTNAITESGQLVNLDMVGNRVAALAFGPRNVVLFIGRNKIVKDLESAMKRIKEIAAPANAKSHTDLKLPCQVSGKCSDCRSPQRICNTWTITEKSYPKNRIKIILIDKELGY